MAPRRDERLRLAERLEPFVADFDGASRAAAEPAWLRARRGACASARSPRAGSRRTRDEEWRFTNVAPIADDGVRAPASVLHVSPRAARGPDCSADAAARARLRQRPLRAALSSMPELPAGVEVGSLAQRSSRRRRSSSSRAWRPRRSRAASVHGAQHRASSRTARSSTIADGVVVERPMHAALLSRAGAGAPARRHPRLLVVAGEHSAGRRSSRPTPAPRAARTSPTP